MSARKKLLDEIVVSDGRLQLGTVTPLLGHYEAYSVVHGLLGLYETRDEGRAAILEAHRRREARNAAHSNAA